jgi:hypothetical protein
MAGRAGARSASQRLADGPPRAARTPMVGSLPLTGEVAQVCIGQLTARVRPRYDCLAPGQACQLLPGGAPAETLTGQELSELQGACAGTRADVRRCQL